LTTQSGAHVRSRQRAEAALGGALTVVYDIALAARFADRLVWMKDGEIVADGPPAETLTPERMRKVFAVAASVTPGDAPDVTISGLA